MKHAKSKQASQISELEKFVANHNKTDIGMTIVIDTERDRIRFNCTEEVKKLILFNCLDEENKQTFLNCTEEEEKNRILYRNGYNWSAFRNKVLFGTKNLLHVITDDELELNYPELNMETTEELFFSRGIFICYLKRKFVKSDLEHFEWLIKFCV